MAQQEDVFDMYLRLHKIWSDNVEWAKHLEALPRLVAAQTIANAIDRQTLAISMSLEQKKTGASGG